MAMMIKLKQIEKTRQSAGVIGTEICDKRLVMDVDTFLSIGGAIVTVPDEKGNPVQHITHSSCVMSDGSFHEKDVDKVFGVLLRDDELCDDGSVPKGWYFTVTANEMLNAVKVRASLNAKTGKITSIVINDAQVVNLVAMFAIEDKNPEMNVAGLSYVDNLSKDLVARGVYHSSTQSKYRYMCQMGNEITHEEGDVKYRIFKIDYKKLSTKKDLVRRADKE